MQILRPPAFAHGQQAERQGAAPITKGILHHIQEALMIKSSGFLTGQLLAALPESRGDETDQSLVFICQHDEKGAMGFVINQPLEGLALTELMQQMVEEGIDWPPSPTEDAPLLWGGPLEMSSLFLLHSLDVDTAQTLEVGESYGITASGDMLKAISRGQDVPKHYLVLLGFMGWKSGELEEDLRERWLVVPATTELVFHQPVQEKWELALRHLGVDQSLLTRFVGQA
jgi:putative transcriptional regulator